MHRASWLLLAPNLGFQKIPIEKIGLQKDEYRTTLP